MSESVVSVLQRRLNRQALDAMVPLGNVLEITWRCNYRCSMCYVLKQERIEELDTAAWTSIVDELQQCGSLFLLVTGGEPLLRRDALEVIDRARSAKQIVTLYTNGSLIDRETARDLAALRLLEIGVTLYGATAAAHDRNSCCSGSFERVVAGIRYLKELGVNVRLRCNLVPSTEAEMLGVYELACALGVRWGFNALISARRDGTPPETSSDAAVAGFYRELYRRVPGALDEYLPIEQFPPRAPDSAVCGAGRNGVRIGPDGRVYPCVDLDDDCGDLRQQRFAEVWRSSPGLARWRRLRASDFATCTECRLQPLCTQQCPGRFLRGSGSEVVPDRETCRIVSIARSEEEAFVRTPSSGSTKERGVAGR